MSKKNTHTPLICILFIRYHLSTSDNKRSPPLETREATSASDPSWNDHVHLECHGSAEELGRQKVVFELRSRRGWGRSSSLLGRGEVAWGDALASTPDMSMERWVVMDREGKVGEGEMAMLLVGMKVGVPEKVKKVVGLCRRGICPNPCPGRVLFARVPGVMADVEGRWATQFWRTKEGSG
ncbi:hypothetical protein QJS10_CPB19g01435 [Acorus calamus]|uniref:C2 domain-containing protein n=1 Tax=Acorus calamus TaxID=4465 RepID=A0AAV9CG71_ACOCL|nr:hypothetical protein QJS10_CPB19g01435 [Acorus calamus]